MDERSELLLIHYVFDIELVFVSHLETFYCQEILNDSHSGVVVRVQG